MGQFRSKVKLLSEQNTDCIFDALKFKKEESEYEISSPNQYWIIKIDGKIHSSRKDYTITPLDSQSSLFRLININPRNSVLSIGFVDDDKTHDFMLNLTDFFIFGRKAFILTSNSTYSFLLITWKMSIFYYHIQRTDDKPTFTMSPVAPLGRFISYLISASYLKDTYIVHSRTHILLFSKNYLQCTTIFVLTQNYIESQVAVFHKKQMVLVNGNELSLYDFFPYFYESQKFVFQEVTVIKSVSFWRNLAILLVNNNRILEFNLLNYQIRANFLLKEFKEVQGISVFSDYLIACDNLNLRVYLLLP